MVKFDASPTLKQGKCISQSHPGDWGHGGSYSEGKHSAVAAKSQAIVTTGSGGGEWAKGGGDSNVGKQSVKALKSS